MLNFVLTIVQKNGLLYQKMKTSSIQNTEMSHELSEQDIYRDIGSESIWFKIEN